jgi:hypothetical protein
MGARKAAPQTGGSAQKGAPVSRAYICASPGACRSGLRSHAPTSARLRVPFSCVSGTQSRPGHSRGGAAHQAAPTTGGSAVSAYICARLRPRFACVGTRVRRTPQPLRCRSSAFLAGTDAEMSWSETGAPYLGRQDAEKSECETGAHLRPRRPLERQRASVERLSRRNFKPPAKHHFRRFRPQKFSASRGGEFSLLAPYIGRESSRAVARSPS